MPRRKKCVDEDELNAILSAIARGETNGEDGVKISERLKAAELLSKKLCCDISPESEEVRVTVDYV